MDEIKMETRVSLLEMQLKTIERDAEKREKLQDARHAESMAKLSALEAALASGRDFNRGVTSTVKAAWALVGAVVTGLALALINKVMTP